MSLTVKDVSTEELPIQFLQKQLQDIESKLLLDTPDIKEALILLHKNIITNEHLAHILDDEDIALIHSAHEKHKGLVMMAMDEKAAKKSTRVGKINSL